MTENPNPTPPRRRGGRPKAAPEARRGAALGVRLTDAERAEVEARAASAGVTPAQWLRIAGLSRRAPPSPVPAVNRDAYAELARLAANLNQLTRLANEGRVIAPGDLLDQVAAEVAQLRLALLGVTE